MVHFFTKLIHIWLLDHLNPILQEETGRLAAAAVAQALLARPVAAPVPHVRVAPEAIARPVAAHLARLAAPAPSVAALAHPILLANLKQSTG